LHSYSLRVEGYRCEVSPSLAHVLAGAAELAPPPTLPREPEDRVRRGIARLLDRATPVDEIRLTPNRIYVAPCGEVGAAIEVSVKEFSGRTMRARWNQWIRQASRAERNWRAARAVMQCGIRTPEPLLLANPSRVSDPSYYGCRYLRGALEARQVIKAANAGRAGAEFPQVSVERILAEMGDIVRTLHGAGLWHRDLTSGNFLLWPWNDPANLSPFLIDLDRTRIGRTITRVTRIRELGRLPVFRREHQDVYLHGYYGDRVPRLDALLYRIHHRLYHLRARLRVQGGKAIRRWLYA